MHTYTQYIPEKVVLTLQTIRLLATLIQSQINHHYLNEHINKETIMLISLNCLMRL